MKRAASDPFGERMPLPWRARFDVLGGNFSVASTDPELLDLASAAFGRVPKYRLVRQPPRFEVRLVLLEHGCSSPGSQVPPPPVLSAGMELLCGTIDACNFAVIDVGLSRALICVSRTMLRYPYHVRYELIELAFLTLASRAQSLVPLHAACLGASGKGVLLVGESGAGKSTLSLHGFAAGLELLSEDSAFVTLDGLRVMGVPNYLHLGPGTLELVPAELRSVIERSPVIQRRSGARKHEVDVRALPGRIARAPLRLAATVFLSRRRARGPVTLRPLERETCLAQLRREQPYASGHANWEEFERVIANVPSYELERGENPDVAVRQLRDLLA